jgi:hypothetical protein
MDWAPASIAHWLFDPQRGPSGRLLPRWLFLRALGLIYFSAFFSLVLQIRGLIGPQGILPTSVYLREVAQSLGHARFWFAPSLLWFSSGGRMLTGLCWAGTAASLLLVLNLWPRGTLLACFLCFLSLVSAAGDFSAYQSDGMLLEAGFLALFFAPTGRRPGLAGSHPPMRAGMFLLQWEWFRIYFESGVAKLASGDPEWRHLTAMDEYYQNGPLPTWIGWYVQHLPHWFHAGAALATLVLELVLVWMLFLPRRWRIGCFLIASGWQIPVILTANYTFLNYLVLSLGLLLVDDRFLARLVPRRWRTRLLEHIGANSQTIADTPQVEPPSILRGILLEPQTQPSEDQTSGLRDERNWRELLRPKLAAIKLSVCGVMLGWIFYATTAQLVWMLLPTLPLPTKPVAALAPFRVANQYGLFAVMTRGRYEIEFQGSDDGQTWLAYPFRFKPQDPYKPPGIYAPYQPRFDWNLWFASLGDWRTSPIVARTEMRLLSENADVLALFAGNPFPYGPPRQVRAVLWQYWFSTLGEKRAQGLWWRRELLGLYAPVLEREPGDRIEVIQWPEPLPPHD